MSDDDSKTPQEVALVNALGNGGKAVVDFVRSELAANAKTLQDAVDQFNEYVASSEPKESGNTELLTTLRDALNKALGAHGTVATALNDGKQVTPAEVAEAVGATAAVKELENEWKERVDKTLADHGKALEDLKGRVSTLEGKNNVPVLAPVPTPEPNLEPKVVEPKPKVVTIEPNKPDQTNVFVEPSQPMVVRYVNPKLWGGLAWALAIGLLVGGAIIALNVGEYFFSDTPAQLQWLRWLTLWLFPVFGFFLGGTIGSFIESKQSVKQETTVA